MLVRKLIYCLMLAVAVGGVGCEKSSTPDASGNRLVVGLEGDISKLDPRLATDAYSVRIIGIIYSSLLKLDPAGKPYGDLAKSWEQPAPVSYRFQLREGVRFHDGSRLTCEDVKYTYDLIRAEDSESPYKAGFRKIEKITCVDEHNLEIKLSRPFAPFAVNLTMGILPKGVDPERHLENPVGSGPFMFYEWKRGDRIILRRFEDYFGDKAKIEEVVFRVLKNGVTRVLELQKGGVDALQNSVPPKALNMLRKNKNIVVQRQPGINYNYIGFNLEHPALGKEKVREAIAHAVDRDAIIKYLWRGAARPAKSLLSPRHWAYNPDVISYGYDPDKSKKLLDEAGFPDPDSSGPKMRFNLTFKTSTYRLRKRIAEVIRNQLEKVGIGVDVRSYEWGTFYRDVKSGNFEMYTLAWVGITEPDIYWAIFHSSNIPPNGTGMNRNRYRNAEIDRLTERARRTTDIEERKKLYARVQYIASDELPYVSLYYTDDILARWNYVRGWEIRPGGDFLCLPKVRIER